MALSLRQQAFVSHYLIERNGRRAAIAAGYAPKNAGVYAGELLKNPNIAAAVAEATDKLLKEVHITKGDVLLKLYREASVDPLDAVDEHGRLRQLKDTAARGSAVHQVHQGQAGQPGPCRSS